MILRRSLHGRAVLVLAGTLSVMTAAAVSADRSAGYSAYLDGSSHAAFDESLRDRFDRRGITLTYEAYAKIVDAMAAAPYVEAAPGAKATDEPWGSEKYASIFGPGHTRPEEYAFGFDKNPAFLGWFTDIGGPMPELHIIVSPSPPLDYVVFINNRRYAATSKSIYAVDGPVSIVVRRSGKPDCLWSGTATLDKSQDITCTF